MQMHQITIKKPARSKKRVGRGGKRGTYSGRGGKGQTARAGRNFKPIIREVLKRYPKLRGYKNKTAQIKPEIVDLKKLENNFDSGQIVSPRALAEKGLVRCVSGRYPRVKIMAGGKLSKELRVRDCGASKSAKEQIEKAGGTIKN